MKVEVLEMLGAERLIYGHIGTSPFTLRMESTDVAPRAGDTVRLHVAPEHLHWFDATTGLRV